MTFFNSHRQFFWIDVLACTSLLAACLTVAAITWWYTAQPLDWTACTWRGTDHSLPAGCGSLP